MTRQVNTHQLMTRLLDIQQWELRRAFCEPDELQEAERELERAQCQLAELLRGEAGEQADLPTIVFAPALTQPTPEPEALALAAEVLEESGGADIDTRCYEQAEQGNAKLRVARYLRALSGDELALGGDEG